ncbi:MAG: hypothetical protein IPI91_05665 [Flavobacteriales bacterium]|nr:hypothetical protein [Flavobacteriales bacterium]
MHRIINFLLRSLYTIGIPLCCSTAVCAQPFLLRGTVYDNQTNETLPGASVKLKGATGGAMRISMASLNSPYHPYHHLR